MPSSAEPRHAPETGAIPHSQAPTRAKIGSHPWSDLSHRLMFSRLRPRCDHGVHKGRSPGWMNGL
jgi:hypothetical protein